MNSTMQILKRCETRNFSQIEPMKKRRERERQREEREELDLIKFRTRDINK
jgi:hypothetical protein